MVIPQKARSCPVQEKKVHELLQKLSIEEKDISLYILAFIHRSIVNERNEYAPEHNERLEFLWDAVLELVITHALYEDFPQKQEWEMTDMRSALVRGRNLAVVSKKLDFQNYLLLGKWEEKSGWRENDYLLANTMESFIWALYTDLWYEIARDFILVHIYSTLPDILQLWLFRDYKTLLQEFVQAQYDITPHYELLSESWPDHSKVYVIGAYMWKKLLGSWEGSSKKKWQEKAAESAYISLQT